MTIFIKVIRELYVNKPLIKTSDELIQCSTKGNLYFKNSVQEIHSKKAKLLWEKLHENRDKLLVFEESRRELEKSLERMNN